MIKQTHNQKYPRDLVGYANNPPDPKWPGQAKIALQFVLNYEEGGESCILHGDNHSEAFLSEIISAKAYQDDRHLSMESIYEYGSRVGIWRLLKLFESFDIPITIFAVAMALQRNPKLARYFADRDYDICSHGYRWIDYQFIDEKTEKEHIKKSIDIIHNLTGRSPQGWYTGRNSPNTRRLIVETGGFLYDSDAYNDDLPYWADDVSNKHLIIPYTLDVNDMRFATPQGFNSGEQFYQYLKDTFDALYLEGEQAPKMMSVGMHCRLLGRPGRIMALRRFIEYTKNFDRIWYCSRIDIAKHWHNHF